MTILVFLGSLIGAMALGMPIAFALMACGLALMVLLGNFDTQIFAQNLLDGANNFPLMSIPFFMLAGQLMGAGGISKRIINMAMALVGHWRGGLGYVAIFAAILLASVSGSAVADSAALVALLLPVMANAGYDKNRAGGLLASAGIVAPMLPPSVGFIVFGVAANQSITKLFMAGILPGILLALAVGGTWWFLSRKEVLPVNAKKTWAEVFASLREGFWALLMPVIIIGGLKLGIFTPTETGAVVVVYALVVGLFVYKELKFRELPVLFAKAARMSAMIMFMVATAQVSSWLVNLTDLPDDVASLLAPFLDHQFVLLLIINVIVFLVGMVMEMIPAILILTPVLLPIILKANIDPVYFGVLFVLNNAIGLIHPPVGIVFNLVCGIGRLSMVGLLRGILPFLLAELGVLFLLILFPWLVTGPLKWLM